MPPAGQAHLDQLIDDRGDGLLDRPRATRPHIQVADGTVRKSKMGLKRDLAVVTLMGALVMAIPARAQQSTPPPIITSEGAPTRDLPIADYQAFDGFAVAHPDIVRELCHRPRLIEDGDYLARHSELRDFLASHAELRAAMIEDPGNFLATESRHPTDGSDPDQ